MHMFKEERTVQHQILLIWAVAGDTPKGSNHEPGILSFLSASLLCCISMIRVIFRSKTESFSVRFIRFLWMKWRSRSSASFVYSFALVQMVQGMNVLLSRQKPKVQAISFRERIILLSVSVILLRSMKLSIFLYQQFDGIIWCFYGPLYVFGILYTLRWWEGFKFSYINSLFFFSSLSIR